MKRLKRVYWLLHDLFGARIGRALLYLFLPMIILMLYGIGLSIRYGHLFSLSLTLLITTLLMMIPSLFLSKKRNQKRGRVGEKIRIEQGEIPSFAEPSKLWSEEEVELWRKMQQENAKALKEQSDWSTLDQHALAIHHKISAYYGKKELDFTLIEALTMIETVSERYRHLLHRHIPAIEYLPISTLKEGYRLYDRYGARSAKLVQYALYGRTLYNALFDPSKMVTDALRERTVGQDISNLGADLLLTLKQSLLDDVAALSIDLHSGRFELGEGEERNSSGVIPRLLIIGGEEENLATLEQTLQEELPHHERLRYECLSAKRPERKEEFPNFIELLTTADLILWSLSADQPAKSVDLALKEALMHHFETLDPLKPRPKILFLLMRIESLMPAKFDETLLKEMLHYNHSLFAPSPLLPLPKRDSSALLRWLTDHYSEIEESAKRRKIGEKRPSFSWREQLKRVGRVTESYLKNKSRS